jgi:hypothetical protein
MIDTDSASELLLSYKVLECSPLVKIGEKEHVQEAKFPQGILDFFHECSKVWEYRRKSKK